MCPITFYNDYFEIDQKGAQSLFTTYVTLTTNTTVNEDTDADVQVIISLARDRPLQKLFTRLNKNILFDRLISIRTCQPGSLLDPPISLN